MTVTKIAILVGASIITAGSSAAVATRDKWWPGEKTKPVVDGTNSGSDGVGSGSAAGTSGVQNNQSGGGTPGAGG